MFKVIHNMETNEVLQIPLDEKEIAELEKESRDNQIIQSEIKLQNELKASAQLKLAALGLTVDEITAIVK